MALASRPVDDRSRKAWTQSLVTFATAMRGAVFSALRHDALTLGQATAYSAIVALFPALIVAAAVVTLLPETLAFRVQMAIFFNRVLPPNVAPLLDAYFVSTAGAHSSPHAARVMLGSIVVSISGASSVMASLMEGFRRAHDLPLARGSFWPRRRRALALVPLSLLPMTAASVLVVFGNLMTHWLVGEVAPALRSLVYVLAFLVRWTVALAGSVGIIAVIYHLGTDLSRSMSEELAPLLRSPWTVWRKDWSWRSSLPGAAVATLLWFVTTLGFGFYVTRFANYSQVYGSLGAGIALMFWLYIIALSVLMGAEFNAQRSKTEMGPPGSAGWSPGLQTTGRMAD
jgi:membrane protein